MKGVLLYYPKRFQPIIRVVNNSQEKFTILHVPHIGFLCYLTQTRFCCKKVCGKQGMIYMLLCKDFVKFNVQTNQKCSRDNGKVATFMHYPSCLLRLGFSFLSGPVPNL